MRAECETTGEGAAPGPFFEGSPEPSLVLDSMLSVRALNRAFTATFGWTRPQAVGRPVADLVGDRDAEALAGLTAEGLLEARVLAPDGRARAAEWRLAPGPGGTVLAVVSDAEEKAAERLRARAVERAAGIGNWEMDLADRTVRWSPGLYDLYGVDPGAFDPTHIDWMTFFEGESALRFAEAAALLVRDGAPFDLELEAVTATGRTIWTRATGARDGPGRLYGTLSDVTAERARRRNLERLGALARLTTNAVVVTDAAGRIEWVNHAFTDQTGYPAEEVVGRTADLLDSPSSDPRAMDGLRAAFAAGEPFRGEIRNLRRDGREIAVELELQPMLDGDDITGWVAIRNDVTDERRNQRRLERAEREAEASHARLAAAVEALDDAFVLYDDQERLVICNQRFRELYEETAPAIAPGRTLEELIRYGIARGQWPEAVGREEEWLAARLAAHRSADQPIERALSGGRWVRVVERPTPDGGRVGLQLDITPLKRQQRVLQDALRRAEEANEAKSAFLATMSHEIRTPMNGILGLADLLSETPLDPRQDVLVEDLRSSGESLLRILNDILDFSKIEAGQVSLETIPFQPAEIARRIEALHGPLAREKGLALRIEAAPGPLRLGDPTRLLQVLGNLVANSVKFTAAGEVAVRIANPDAGELRIEVADTGIGMTLEESARVFERFAQADNSVTRRFGGTGLGLSIVRGIVAAMGGQLEVWSVPGEGTQIGVSLPLAVAAAPRVVPMAVPSASGLGGVRILAADDNAMNRRVLAGMLKRLGATHEVVASGAEAVEAARAGGHDLLLLDISMPGMDGIETLHAIEEEARAAGRAAPPALAVTANVLEAQVESYLAAGFVGHLPKPVRIPALDAAAKAALGRASAA